MLNQKVINKVRKERRLLPANDVFFRYGTVAWLVILFDTTAQDALSRFGYRLVCLAANPEDNRLIETLTFPLTALFTISRIAFCARITPGKVKRDFSSTSK